ncbi:MAG: hypothetical protein AAFX01_11060 [Cyanobacteria bacterium J06638_28]
MADKHYAQRKPDDYLQRLSPGTRAALSLEQVQELKQLLHEAIPKPSPKIVDLRIVLDLLVTRYYIVIWVGKDRRKSPRRHTPTRLARVGNFVTACLLLLALNLTVTGALFMSAYLLKSAAGIDLLPGHLNDLAPSLD